MDTSSLSSLWKDRVVVEVNTAVMHSFKLAGVSIVDQVNLSNMFDYSYLQTPNVVIYLTI